MAAGILPPQRREIRLCEGMAIVSTELLRYGGMKPVIETRGKNGPAALIFFRSSQNKRPKYFFS